LVVVARRLGFDASLIKLADEPLPGATPRPRELLLMPERIRERGVQAIV
jgi:hypothetical protein